MGLLGVARAQNLVEFRADVTQWVRVHDGSMFMVGNTQFLYQEVLASFPGQEEPGNEARKVC